MFPIFSEKTACFKPSSLFLNFCKKDIMVLSDQVASKRRKPDVSVTYIKKIIKTTKHKETISDSTAVRDLIGKYWQLL